MTTIVVFIFQFLAKEFRLKELILSLSLLLFKKKVSWMERLKKIWSYNLWISFVSHFTHTIEYIFIKTVSYNIANVMKMKMTWISNLAQNISVTLEVIRICFPFCTILKSKLFLGMGVLSDVHFKFVLFWLWRLLLLSHQLVGIFAPSRMFLYSSINFWPFHALPPNKPFGSWFHDMCLWYVLFDILTGIFFNNRDIFDFLYFFSFFTLFSH